MKAEASIMSRDSESKFTEQRRLQQNVFPCGWFTVLWQMNPCSVFFFVCLFFPILKIIFLQAICIWWLIIRCDSLVAKLYPTLATPWTVARQAPLSMGFLRQEYWSGLPVPSPGDLSNLRNQNHSSCITGRLLPCRWILYQLS